MSSVRISFPARAARGHTLIELMVAITVGMFLLLGAFSVMAAFEGHKRTTTAVNDALQSGNYGLYSIDKLIRSAGSGVARYGAVAGWGCGLNYTPNDPGTGTNGTTVTSGGAPALPAPFSSVFSGAGISALRLAPVVIFPGALAGSGAPATTDALLMMQGGGGFAEAPVYLQQAPSGQVLVESNVGFSAGEWVLVGGPGLGNCMITKVATGFSSVGNNVSLPLQDNAIGSATGLVSAGNYIVAVGQGKAANFLLYGVGTGTSTTYASSLWSVDLLNSTMTTATAVTDDVVMMRAVYLVRPKPTDPLTWTNPVDGVVINGTTYNYSPKMLMAGDAGASTSLKSIVGVRVAMIVRAPLNEKNTGQTINGSTIAMFANMVPTAPASIPVTWTPPGTAATQNYRYREIETTIPIRNGLM